ncbi:MAG: Smr/MutS family protein [Desulfosoma sp.]
MSRKRKKSTPPPPSIRTKASPADEQGFYTPFSCLDQYGKRKTRRSSARNLVPETGTAPGAAGDESFGEERLFLEAMADVVPLPQDARQRVPPGGPTGGFPRFAVREDWEVLAHLADLVSGESRFSVHYSDEYMDGAVVGLAPTVLKRLRNGDFSYQDHVDLHGLTRQEAQDRVTDFLLRSHARGVRCVLVICGRGLNSQGKEPVLKRELVNWMTRAPLKRLVLAFASARTWDGGAGAVYVLLRRRKGKAPVRTPAL